MLHRSLTKKATRASSGTKYPGVKEVDMMSMRTNMEMNTVTTMAKRLVHKV